MRVRPDAESNQILLGFRLNFDRNQLDFRSSMSRLAVLANEISIDVGHNSTGNRLRSGQTRVPARFSLTSAMGDGGCRVEFWLFSIRIGPDFSHRSRISHSHALDLGIVDSKPTGSNSAGNQLRFDRARSPARSESIFNRRQSNLHSRASRQTMLACRISTVFNRKLAPIQLNSASDRTAVRFQLNRDRIPI